MKKTNLILMLALVFAFGASACSNASKNASQGEDQKTKSVEKPSKKNTQDKTPSSTPDDQNATPQDGNEPDAHENCGCDHASLSVEPSLLQGKTMPRISPSEDPSYLHFDFKDDQWIALFTQGPAVDEVSIEDPFVINKDIEFYKSKKQCDAGFYLGQYSTDIRQTGDFCGTNLCYTLDPLEFTVIDSETLIQKIKNKQLTQACGWSKAPVKNWKIYLLDPSAQQFATHDGQTKADLQITDNQATLTFADHTIQLSDLDDKPMVSEGENHQLVLYGISLDGKNITHMAGSMILDQAPYVLIGISAPKQVTK